MNNTKIAAELVRIAKTIMGGSSARPIAVSTGYFTNSGLDMAQHEESRSVVVTISVDGAGNLTGEAQFETNNASSGKDRWKETTIFGGIGGAPTALIERWTKKQYATHRIEYKANQWKSGIGGSGRGGYRLEKLIDRLWRNKEETVDSLLDPLDKVDMAVLLATKGLKSQYAGDPDARKTEIRRKLGISGDKVDKSRDKLIRLGFMRRNKAISPKGREAVEAIGELLGEKFPDLNSLKRL